MSQIQNVFFSEEEEEEEEDVGIDQRNQGDHVQPFLLASQRLVDEEVLIPPNPENGETQASQTSLGEELFDFICEEDIEDDEQVSGKKRKLGDLDGDVAEQPMKPDNTSKTKRVCLDVDGSENGIEKTPDTGKIERSNETIESVKSSPSISPSNEDVDMNQIPPPPCGDSTDSSIGRGGFSTGGGKLIKIKESSVRKASSLFNTEEGKKSRESGRENFSKSSGNKSNVKKKKIKKNMLDLGQSTSGVSGFSTAGGRKLKIKKKSLDETKDFFDNSSSARGIEDIPPPPPPVRGTGGFSTASGKEIKINKKSLKKASSLFGEGNVEVKAKKKKKKKPVGFSTASGKRLKIKKKSMEKANTLFSDDRRNASRTVTGFSTGKGKRISASKENVLKASTILQNNGKENDPKQIPPPPPRTKPSSSFSGFSTGGGKKLKPSKKSVMKANSIFNSNNKGSGSSSSSSSKERVVSGFSTAGGKKLKPSKKSILKANSIFKNNNNNSNNNDLKSTPSLPSSNNFGGFSTAGKGKKLKPKKKKKGFFDEIGNNNNNNNIKSIPRVTPAKTFTSGFSTAGGKEVNLKKKFDPSSFQFLQSQNGGGGDPVANIGLQYTSPAANNTNRSNSLSQDVVFRRMEISSQNSAGSKKKGRQFSGFTSGGKKKKKLIFHRRSSDRVKKMFSPSQLAKAKKVPPNIIPQSSSSSQSNNNEKPPFVDPFMKKSMARKKRKKRRKKKSSRRRKRKKMVDEDEEEEEDNNNEDDDPMKRTKKKKRKKKKKKKYRKKIRKFKSPRARPNTKKKQGINQSPKKSVYHLTNIPPFIPRKMTNVDRKRRSSNNNNNNNNNDNNNRTVISLSKLSKNRPLKSYGELRRLGISKLILDMDSVQAMRYRFPTQSLLPEFRMYLENLLKQNSMNINNNNNNNNRNQSLLNNTVGPNELRRCMLSFGASPKHCSIYWVENHYRWIVWKICTMVRRFPEECGHWFSFRMVLSKLIYRYQMEHSEGKRSCFDLITTKDDISQKFMVLCVARVYESCPFQQQQQQQQQGNMMQGGGGQGQQQMNDQMDDYMTTYIELTDGQYGLTGKLDSSLSRMVEWGRIVPGTKLKMCNALIQCEACPIMSVPNSAHLQVFYNSTRVTSPFAQLGFPKNTNHFRLPFLINLKSVPIEEDGGPLPQIMVQVVRQYPLLYFDQNKKIFMDRFMNENLRNEYMRKREQIYEKKRGIIQNEIEEEERRMSLKTARKYAPSSSSSSSSSSSRSYNNNNNNSRSRKKKSRSRKKKDITKIEDGEVLYYLRNSNATMDMNEFMNSLSNDQRRTLSRYEQRAQDRNRSDFEKRMEEEFEEAGLQSREITTYFTCLVRDCCPYNKEKEINNYGSYEFDNINNNNNNNNNLMMGGGGGGGEEEEYDDDPRKMAVVSYWGVGEPVQQEYREGNILRLFGAVPRASGAGYSMIRNIQMKSGCSHQVVARVGSREFHDLCNNNNNNKKKKKKKRFSILQNPPRKVVRVEDLDDEKIGYYENVVDVMGKVVHAPPPQVFQNESNGFSGSGNNNNNNSNGRTAADLMADEDEDEEEEEEEKVNSSSATTPPETYETKIQRVYLLGKGDRIVCVKRRERKNMKLVWRFDVGDVIVFRNVKYEKFEHYRGGNLPLYILQADEKSVVKRCSITDSPNTASLMEKYAFGLHNMDRGRFRTMVEKMKRMV